MAVFPHLLSGLTLSCGSHRISHQQDAGSSSSDLWLCECLSNRQASKSVLVQPGDVQHPVTGPVGNALSIPSALSMGREEMLLWTGLAHQRVLVPGGGKKRRSKDKRKQKTLGYKPLGNLCLLDHCCHLS